MRRCPRHEYCSCSEAKRKAMQRQIHKSSLTKIFLRFIFAFLQGEGKMHQPPSAERRAIDHTGQNHKPKLLDQVRAAIRVRPYSLRTEQAYIHWIKRFIFFHHKRHPAMPFLDVVVSWHFFCSIPTAENKKRVCREEQQRILHCVFSATPNFGESLTARRAS